MTVREIQRITRLRAGQATREECRILAKLACLMTPEEARQELEKEVQLERRVYESAVPVVPDTLEVDQIMEWAQDVHLHAVLLAATLKGELNIEYADGEISFSL